MRHVLIGIVFAAASIVTAQAATKTQPSAATAPFGTDWAQPYPTTGGYIYDDPRTRSRAHPAATGSTSTTPRCPNGTAYVPSMGACR